MRSKRTTPIGLDIRDSEVHAVQFEVADGRPALRAAAVWAVPPASEADERAPALLAALRSLSLDRRFVGRKVVSALPANQVDVRPLRLRPGVTPEDGAAFQENLILEARSSLLYSPEEAYIDYVPLGTTIEDGQQKYAVLLIAARREHVNRHLAVLRAAHLDCVHIEPGAPAALRMLRDGDGTVAFLDVDADTTSISVGKQGGVLFSRTVSTGTRGMIRSLAQALRISEKEALRTLRTYGTDPEGSTAYDLAMAAETGLLPRESLRALLFSFVGQALGRIAEEIRRSLDYFSRQRRGGSIDKAFLVGVEMPAGMAAHLEKEIGTKVIAGPALAQSLQIDPSVGLGGPTPSRDPMPNLPSLAAMGLALREEV
ncbi:pilus assembly protein PilM [Candidatus Sumerlaeota bacterium]|nr:pilus assembly protein PilM [Candidatus Sumerlaeota bacterium]